MSKTVAFTLVNGQTVTVGTDWDEETVEKIKHWLLGSVTEASAALDNVDWFTVKVDNGDEHHIARQHIVAMHVSTTAEPEASTPS